MSQSTNKKRRASGIDVQPKRIAKMLEQLRRGDVLLKLIICTVAALLLWACTGAWAPPFAYREGFVPPRDIIARVKFSVEDRNNTELLKARRKREALCIYENRVEELVNTQALLKQNLSQFLVAEDYATLNEAQLSIWKELLPENSDEPDQLFDAFLALLKTDPELKKVESAVRIAMSDMERDGLLTALGHSEEEGNPKDILVYSGDQNINHRVSVESVLRTIALPQLKEKLISAIEKEGFADTDQVLSNLIHHWLISQLPDTLTYNAEASDQAREDAARKVEPQFVTYGPNENLKQLAASGVPLEQGTIRLLKLEHAAIVKSMSWKQRLFHSLADLGMYIAMYILCGIYIFFHAPEALTDMRKFVTLLSCCLTTIILCFVLAIDSWQAEIIPLLLFSVMMVMAYDKEMAMLLSSAVALITTVSLNQGLAEFVILLASAAAMIQFLGKIRSRTKLIYVGLCVSIVTFSTTLGVGTLDGQLSSIQPPVEQTVTTTWEGFFQQWVFFQLINDALWNGFCAILSGVLLTGLLPFIEKLFGVQTDLSLLELGDIAHPLLQELVRRAPGTYNHSINVASIGEAAAEAIGANGLLVRVGAYFHDIGKMLKPGYFVENQGTDESRHESLLPAMSTLVIIAHVKDGAELARQHHLPQQIINFIEQHHGTTLVAYFYNQATRQSEEDPDHGPVDEANYRYPGPKPQSREAGVMMLSDAVESASRALVEPAPARIESLVHEIAMQKLLDGQFDECGLTLKEIHIVEESLVKSLTAVYHGRVKYPDQQTA